MLETTFKNDKNVWILRSKIQRRWFLHRTINSLFFILLDTVTGTLTTTCVRCQMSCSYSMLKGKQSLKSSSVFTSL